MIVLMSFVIIDKTKSHLFVPNGFIYGQSNEI